MKDVPRGSMPFAPLPRNYATSAAHPGFAAVAKSLAGKVSNPGAVLAASARKASPAAVKKNPRLAKISGVKKPKSMKPTNQPQRPNQGGS